MTPEAKNLESNVESPGPPPTPEAPEGASEKIFWKACLFVAKLLLGIAVPILIMLILSIVAQAIIAGSS